MKGYRSGNPVAHRLDQVVARRMVEMLGQIDEVALELDHDAASLPSSTRRRCDARDSRDFTVPNGHDKTSAVSLSLNSAK